jgi:NAD(P)-dependent dehydrogenase (short-subunit alcohol dehydrogenase family)
MNQDLSGRSSIVTGGGTGIGRGVALALAQAGVRVVVCGRRKEPLQAVCQEIQSLGGECRAVQADVAREADVQRVIAEAEQAFGGVDILINNAAIGGGGGEIHQSRIEDWDEVIAVNLRGPFLMIRAVLPGMRSRHQGEIVNISSEAGLEYYPGNDAYGVSKHALNDLAEYTQRENQDFGIRVNTICPGMVVTDMSGSFTGLNNSKCLYPEDIADLVMWLLTRRPNVKIGRPVLIQTMENPWE